MKAIRRKLTRDEFNDLVLNASDGLESVNHIYANGKDAYSFFNVDNISQSIVIDDVPVYCGCVDKNHFTYTVIRKECREKYPKSLYKIVKATVIEWAKMLGDVRCEMVCSSETNLVRRWIEKMGYIKHDNIFILTGRA